MLAPIHFYDILTLKLFSLLTKLQGGLHLQISSLVGYFNKKNTFLVKQ